MALVLLSSTILWLPPATAASPAPLAGGDTSSYLIFLKDQQSHAASVRVRELFEPTLTALTDQRTALVSSIKDLDRPEVVGLNRQVDVLLGQMRGAIASEASRLHASTRAIIESMIADLGGVVHYRSPLLNLLAARLPEGAAEILRMNPLVASVDPDSSMELQLDMSVPSISAPTFWGGGFTGGPFKIVVPDTGVDSTHPALVGKISDAQVFHDQGQMQGNYIDNPTNPDDLHGHGTHIAGIVASQDATYRGVAYGMLGVVNVKFGYICTACPGGASGQWSDAMKGIDWSILTVGGDVLTFSYGGGNDNDGTDPMSRFMDAVVDDLGIPISAAAGNNGGASSIIQPATAYNLMTVGAMDDRNTVSRGDDGIAGFSSRGPTGDGRIKPDIVAPGSDIISTAHSWEGGGTGNDWVAFWGTSMASPHVGASLILYLNAAGGAMFPARAKAVLLNTATDLGNTGPDNTFGWGYLDLATTWTRRNNVAQDDADEGVPQFFKLPGALSDRATMVWQKHVVYNGINAPATSNPLNNLEMFLYDEMANTRLDSSTSVRDNVEQVQFPSAAPGVVKVTVNGALGNLVSTEPFAIAGVAAPVAVDPAMLAPTVNAPPSANQGDTFLVSANVANLGELRVFGARVRLNVPPGLTLVSGPNPAILGTILEGTTASAAWTLSASVAGPHVLTADADGNAYEESYAGTSPPVTISVADTEPPTILAESATPSPQNPGGPVNISATVLDNVALSDVSVEVWDPVGTSLGSSPMPFDPSSGRRYLVRPYVSLGDYQFTITAIDTSTLTASASGTFRIQDMLAPTIANVVASPNPQEVFGAVNVTATVTDNLGVVGTYLEVASPGGTTNVSMNRVATQVSLERTYDILGSYDFRISAHDAAGNWASATGSFLVRDTTAPLADAGPDQSVEFGSSFLFNGSASTDNVGIVSYEWTFVEIVPVMLSGATSSYTFTTLGTFVVTLTVTDSSGNQDTDVLTVVVKEARPPEIHDVRATPPVQDVGLPVIVSARIWDAFGVAEVQLRVRDPDGASLVLTMVLGGPRYEGTVPGAIIGQYVFEIWAVDTNGNENSTSGAFLVSDLSPPSVLMTAAPDLQDIFGTVDVTASVQDNHQISQVWTEIRDPAGQTPRIVPMVFDGQAWRAAFAPVVLGPHRVIVWATDASGNLGFASSTVRSVDRTPPVLLVEASLLAEVFMVVPFTASVSDDLGSYIATLEVRGPSGESLGNRTILGAPPVEMSWVFNSLGPHPWTAWAVDPSGNSVLAGGTIGVRDSQAPVAQAGPDRVVTKGTWVPFDGSGSTDNYGIASYTWTLTATGGHRESRGPIATFEFDHVETVDVQLSVVDLAGNVDTDIAHIRVLAIDRDGDGLSDEHETTVHTDPSLPDTDGDGLLDGKDPDPITAEFNAARWFFSWWTLLILVVIFFAMLALAVRPKKEQPAEAAVATASPPGPGDARIVGTIALPPPPVEDEVPPPPPE